MNARIASLILFFATSLCCNSFGQNEKKAYLQAHGTINVLLANKNGLVAVTDSMLTGPAPNFEHPQESAPKLFKLDDHTICTVANAYIADGPTGDPIVALNIPASIEEIARKFKEIKSILDFKEKVRILTTILSIELDANMLSNNALHTAGFEPSSVQLTVAGYDDDGTLKLAEIEIAPTSDAPHSFEIYPSSVMSKTIPATCEIAGIIDKEARYLRTVSDGFICRIAGYSGIAEQYLSNPTKSADVNLELYAKLYRNSELDKASTDELLRIAVSLEKQTELNTLQNPKLHHEVGKDRQTAVLANGKIQDFQSVPNPYPRPLKRGITVMTDVSFNGSRVALVADDSNRTVVVNGTFNNASVVLDGTYFDHCLFANAQLVYQGNYPLYLGEIEVLDSTLILGSKTDMNDPKIRDLINRVKWKAIYKENHQIGEK